MVQNCETCEWWGRFESDGDEMGECWHPQCDPQGMEAKRTDCCDSWERCSSKENSSKRKQGMMGRDAVEQVSNDEEGGGD